MYNLKHKDVGITYKLYNHMQDASEVLHLLSVEYRCFGKVVSFFLSENSLEMLISTQNYCIIKIAMLNYRIYCLIENSTPLLEYLSDILTLFLSFLKFNIQRICKYRYEVYFPKYYGDGKFYPTLPLSSYAHQSTPQICTNLIYI